MLDFRDSFFPYIGLIVTIGILCIVIIPAILMNHKKTLFWSIGNLVGYYIGWLLLWAFGSMIASTLTGLIPSIGDIDKSVFVSVLEQVVPIPWFLGFLLLWNVLILIPNYFIWYKRVTGLKGIQNGKLATSNRTYIPLKIGMALFSIIAYAPIAISAGNIIESITVSQSNINATNKTMGNTFDTLSNITYTHGTRTNIDALQAIVLLTTKDIQIGDESLKPIDVIANSFKNFFETITEGEDLDKIKAYIDANFYTTNRPWTDPTETWYLKWYDEDYFGNKFYLNRTISNVASQMILPTTMGNAATKLLSENLGVDGGKITYQELAVDEFIPQDDMSQNEKVSLATFMNNLLEKNEHNFSYTAEGQQQISITLRLFKEDQQSNVFRKNRIKILAPTYKTLCETMGNKIIENGDDPQDKENMQKLVEDTLMKIFFTDEDQNGNLYTKASQISSTF